MQGSVVSLKPVSALPPWIRIAAASLMFVDTALYMSKHFLQFMWVSWFCFGLYFLLYVPRQKGEAPGTYFSKPRTIISLALLITALVGSGHNLYIIYTR